MNRNYGIDLLRIYAMCMVVILHIVGFGGILTNVEPNSANYFVGTFLQTAAYCAVNCYALISGYVGLKSKFKYTSIVMLWLKVVFYTLLITLLFMVFTDNVNGLVYIKLALMPVTNKQYWYFTAYFCLFFFTPLINSAVNGMNKKQCTASVIAAIILFSVFQTFFEEVFNTASGYSVIWLGILYFIGAYIKKYELSLSSKKCILGYISMIIISLAVKFSTLAVYNHLGENYSISFDALKLSNKIVSYTSPTIIFCAVFLLLLFKNFKFSEKTNALISFFAPFSFAIYLIHVHPLVWQYILTERFSFLVDFPAPVMLIALVLIAVCVFLACSFVDYLRSKLFEALKLKDFFRFLENKFLGNIWS